MTKCRRQFIVSIYLYFRFKGGHRRLCLLYFCFLIDTADKSFKCHKSAIFLIRILWLLNFFRHTIKQARIKQSDSWFKSWNNLKVFCMHNSSKGKLKHQIKRNDETVIGRLRKYIVRSRGNAYQHLRVRIKTDIVLRSWIKKILRMKSMAVIA